jgi:hypothetical protein
LGLLSLPFGIFLAVLALTGLCFLAFTHLPLGLLTLPLGHFLAGFQVHISFLLATDTHRFPSLPVIISSQHRFALNGGDLRLGDVYFLSVCFTQNDGDCDFRGII